MKKTTYITGLLILIMLLIPFVKLEAANIYQVQPGDTLQEISLTFNIPMEIIIDNNNIANSRIIFAGQKLIIKPANISHASYTVRTGDSLWIIANKFDTTIEKLREINGLNSTNLLVGQMILIPVKQDKEQKPVEEIDDQYSPYFFYRIREGDKIWSIASTFGVRTSELINFNNISDINNINIDDIIIIPLNKSSKLSYIRSASSRLNNFYRVKHGETLAEIAEFYHIPEESIRTINNLNKNEGIYTGQKLLMPVNPGLFVQHEMYRTESEEYLFDIAYNKGVSVSSILRANYLKNPNTKFEKGTTVLVTLDENSQATWIDYEDGKPVNTGFFR